MVDNKITADCSFFDKIWFYACWFSYWAPTGFVSVICLIVLAIIWAVS